MSEGIFISDKNPLTNRWVIFEDDGVSGWLYLTNPNEKKPVMDCWIYNRILAPSPSEIAKFQNDPPPATNEYAGPNALVTSPEDMKISFNWSNDGSAVALIGDNIPLGFIVVGTKAGFSRNLLKTGPWGNVFNEERYQKVFS